MSALPSCDFYYLLNVVYSELLLIFSFNKWILRRKYVNAWLYLMGGGRNRFRRSLWKKNTANVPKKKNPSNYVYECTKKSKNKNKKKYIIKLKLYTWATVSLNVLQKILFCTNWISHNYKNICKFLSAIIIGIRSGKFHLWIIVKNHFHDLCFISKEWVIL